MPMNRVSFYVGFTRFMCRFNYPIIMASWYGAIAFLFFPSMFPSWKSMVLAIPYFSDFYTIITSRKFTYYLALTGIVLAVAMHVEYKLKSSLEALFPSNVITPQVPLLYPELPNPDVCEVAEKLLHPNGVKQEVVFWIWVLKNAVAAIWFPQLLFGALGYFFK